MSALIGGLAWVLLQAPEGVAPGPAAPLWRDDPLWQAQRRRVRTGTIVAGSLVGASALGLGIASAVLGRSEGAAAPRGAQAAMATSFAVSAVALIIVGAAWERHAALGDRATPRRGSDPRDSKWLRRDRRLTGAMIGTGVVTGGLAIAAMAGFSQWALPCDDGDDCGVSPAPLYVGGAALAGLTGFVTVAVVRAVHRAPVRRWRAEVAAGGLRIWF